MSSISGYLQGFHCMNRMLWLQLCLILLADVFLRSQAIEEQIFVTKPENVSVVEGATAILKCQVGNKQGILQWTRDNFALGKNRNLPNFERYSMVGNDDAMEYNLRIVNASMEDDAFYQCQVTPTNDVGGIRSNTVKLTVLFRPDQPRIHEAPIAPVILGEPTNITCEAKNGKPAAKISWYLNGQMMNRKLYSSEVRRKKNKLVDSIGHVLLVPKSEDSGKILECYAINEALTLPHKTSVKLDVQYPPDIRMQINVTGKIREGMNVQLTCNGFANPQQIKWRWYRNGKHLSKQTGNTLDLPSISHVYNTNTITCEASNAVGSTRKEKKLNIEYGPRFITTTSHVAVDLEENAKLKCEAEGNPQPSIIWRKKGSHHILGSGSTLELREVREADLGTYYCTATVVGFNEICRDVFLLKNGPPQIVGDKQLFIRKDETAHIECMAISVPKPVNMFWMRNGKAIDYPSSERFSASDEELPYGMKSTLQIKNVHAEDFGSYNCSVTNKYGKDMAVITLLEEEVLPMPYIIGGAVGSVAVILIIILACVIYHKYKNTDSGTDSYTDSDSTMEKKKDVKSESPTLMDQWRQDYNKEFYRYSDNYDELYNSKAYEDAWPVQHSCSPKRLQREQAFSPTFQDPFQAYEEPWSRHYMSLKRSPRDPVFLPNFEEQLHSNNNAHVLHTDPYTLDPSNREGSVMPPAYDYVSRPGNDDVPGPADRYESNYNRTYVPRSFKTEITDTSYTMPRLPPADLSNTKFATNV